MNWKRSRTGDRMVTDVVHSVCESGGIGRHMRLKISSLFKAWGFKSPLSHQKIFALKIRSLLLDNVKPII
jgi:hypothetical protein